MTTSKQHSLVVPFYYDRIKEALPNAQPLVSLYWLELIFAKEVEIIIDFAYNKNVDQQKHWSNQKRAEFVSFKIENMT